MGYEADSPDIFVAVFFTKAQSLGEVLAHNVTVKNLYAITVPSQLFLHPLVNCGLAGTAQTCKPHRHAALLHLYSTLDILR
jgi:hypothetical protein